MHYLDPGGGQVVSGLAFFYDDPSSNPAVYFTDVQLWHDEDQVAARFVM